MSNDTFIPLTPTAILQSLQSDAVPLDQLYGLIRHWRHRHHNQMLQDIKDAYLCFSPDRDTIQAIKYSDAEKQQRKALLVRQLSDMLTSANYQALDQQQLEEILNQQSPYGLELKVDLAEYEDVLLFARGETEQSLEYRSWKDLYLKKRQQKLDAFKRLFILVKLKDETQRIKEIMAADDVSEKSAAKKLKKYRAALPEAMDFNQIYLKVFKNVAKLDMEMLFPTTRIGLKSSDKIKLGVTAGGGTGASLFATATKLAAAANPMTAVGALGGLAAVIFRQVSKVISQRNKYMMLMSQKLYFHNLANNRGVLTLLADRAEEEDVKEMLLLMVLGQGHSLDTNNTPVVKSHIESFLKTTFAVDVDFDIEDAKNQLRASGLLTGDVLLGFDAAKDTLKATLIEQLDIH